MSWIFASIYAFRPNMVQLNDAVGSAGVSLVEHNETATSGTRRSFHCHCLNVRSARPSDHGPVKTRRLGRGWKAIRAEPHLILDQLEPQAGSNAR